MSHTAATWRCCFSTIRVTTPGGNGHKFDWSILDSYTLGIPYMLSGGIGSDDIETIRKAMRPGLAGIDLNSRFEVSPGWRDSLPLASALYGVMAIFSE